MMAKSFTVVALAVALCAFHADAAAPSAWGSTRHLLADPVVATADAPGESGKLFNFGRPCRLVGSPYSVQVYSNITNGPCTTCDKGNNVTVADPTCHYKALTAKVGDSINIYYNSAAHNLFLGASPCAFDNAGATEICPNATSSVISATSPCSYAFDTAGSFYISDKSGSGGVLDGSYCSDFSAYLPVTVTSSA